MAKIRLTKGELKKQRDALKQYLRYLPTLQLKKQQLQMEILKHTALLDERRKSESQKQHAAESWAGLLTDPEVNIRQWIVPKSVVTTLKNIAGVDVAVYSHADFEHAEYDLFLYPLWVDSAIEELKALVSLKEEIRILEEGVKILRQELRITTQRVNLFEKVKIPEAEDIIRRIKIYIGDQMANAVGRSKIAKRKIEEAVLNGAAI